MQRAMLRLTSQARVKGGPAWSAGFTRCLSLGEEEFIAEADQEESQC